MLGEAEVFGKGDEILGRGLRGDRHGGLVAGVPRNEIRPPAVEPFALGDEAAEGVAKLADEGLPDVHRKLRPVEEDSANFSVAAETLREPGKADMGDHRPGIGKEDATGHRAAELGDRRGNARRHRRP